jgi:hypothetical protein
MVEFKTIESVFSKPHESTNLTFEKTKTNMLANTLLILRLIYFSPKNNWKVFNFVDSLHLTSFAFGVIS